MKKICFKCGNSKPIEEFYKHKAMGDGHLNKCKSCAKIDVKERDRNLRSNLEYVEKERKRGREKYHRLNYAKKKTEFEIKKSSISTYNKKYPEKKIARGATKRIKPVCVGNHLHHWSYLTEHKKDVIELSPSDHYLLHRFMIYDQERRMYRKLTGELLDTKQSHIDLLGTLK